MPKKEEDDYEDDYEDDFEDEVAQGDKVNESKQADADEEPDGGGWTNIDFSDIELEDKIGGGGVGVVYNGRYKGEPVALKTLVFILLPALIFRFELTNSSLSLSLILV